MWNVSGLVAEGRDRFELRQTYTSTVWKGKKKTACCSESNLWKDVLERALQGGVRGPKEKDGLGGA